jgi:hypothetical protein
MGACCCGGEVRYGVSLAGCGRVNGVYIQTGTYCDRPMFQNRESGIELWYNDGEWRFGHTCDYYYINKSDDQNPPITGWEIADTYCNSDASRPVPNVTKKFCKCC